MKVFASVVLALVSSLALAQVPHVTQPFFHYWDYPSVNVFSTVGFTQVAHFELQYDATVPTILPATIPVVPSSTTGYSTFKLPASTTLALGPHTFNIYACPTLVASNAAASGCVASPVPFAFVLDPQPLPSAQRLGVGV